MRIVFAILIIVCWPGCMQSKQLEPTAKRKQEIRIALTTHGYDPGRTWKDTVSVLKQIAKQHYWQSNHAPDARVLILLGLGNPNSDPDILSWPPSKLEPGVQAEYKLKRK